MGFQWHIHRVVIRPTFSRSNLNLEMLVFVEGRKPEYLEKTPRSRDENQKQTQPTYGVKLRESNPGHIGGKGVLSPLCHPWSHNFGTVLSKFYPYL